jgi:hypothetical protein
MDEGDYMNPVSPNEMRAVLNLFSDGFVFEDFAKSFLSAYFLESFVPVGGVKDRGIDGLEHIIGRKGSTKIFQISIQKTYESKIHASVKKLQENKIDFAIFTFFSNQTIKDKDIICEQLYDEFGVHARVFDSEWIVSNINHSFGTQATYHTFVDKSLVHLQKPGASLELNSMLSDPRLFVFLRQQLDGKREGTELYTILVDTLILFSLEDTDPDRNMLKSKKEIISSIAQVLKFDINMLSNKISKRLLLLSKRPRKIRHYRQIDKFCLPFETRKEIASKNILDKALESNFYQQVEEKLARYLKSNEVIVKKAVELLKATLNDIYYKQGLEFSDFVLKGENPDAVEKQLFDVIGVAVDESSVVPKNKEGVKAALAMTIRDAVYNGTEEQKEYLRRLSNTYMMLFVLRCDPKLATYFDTLASKMTLYVGTSILVPALSEFYLDEHNRRHWNLLKGASASGVRLVVNEYILEELIAHFRKTIIEYRNHYQENEEFYLEDENQILYINHILIRAYFYAKRRGRVKRFEGFIENFINYDMTSVEEDLVEWLNEEFAIQYRPIKNSDIVIDEDDLPLLVDKLKKHKHSEEQARCDAIVILSIYGIREKNQETSDAGIFGFKTWWLSKDQVTYRIVSSIFANRYKISCYIRPDFLYYYISLSPNARQVQETYKGLLPTLLGVNLSYHLPVDIVNTIHDYIEEHKDKNKSRVKGIIRSLVEKLKTDPAKYGEKEVKHYLDEQRELLNQPVDDD